MLAFCGRLVRLKFSRCRLRMVRVFVLLLSVMVSPRLAAMRLLLFRPALRNLVLSSWFRLRKVVLRRVFVRRIFVCRVPLFRTSSRVFVPRVSLSMRLILLRLLSRRRVRLLFSLVLGSPRRLLVMPSVRIRMRLLSVGSLVVLIRLMRLSRLVWHLV